MKVTMLLSKKNFKISFIKYKSKCLQLATDKAIVTNAQVPLTNVTASIDQEPCSSSMIILLEDNNKGLG
jgi:hypothetical protein